jgi:hypothetical protein
MRVLKTKMRHLNKMQIVLLAILVTVTTMFVLGQERDEKKDVHFVVSDPQIIRLDLLARSLERGEEPSVLTQPYVEGEKLRFRLQMTNTSILPVEIPVADTYSQNRPILYKGGDILPYREKVSELLEAREKSPVDKPGWRARLEPSEFKVLDRIDLYEWYDSLGPGHYQLSVKHRFQPGQSWCESSSITFEVVPKPKRD